MSVTTSKQWLVLAPVLMMIAYAVPEPTTSWSKESIFETTEVSVIPDESQAGEHPRTSSDSAGEIETRGVLQNRLPQGTVITPATPTPAPPPTKVPVPGITAPAPGTALPPDRYQAPTPNLTMVANALRLKHKSLTAVVTLPPNLPVTQQVDIGIIYSSPAGIGQMKQSYARGTGNRFFYNEREGDGKPRAMEITITLTEPSLGEAGIYRIKWRANLDPLYHVAIGVFNFELLTKCDTVGATEILFRWRTPEDQHPQARFSTSITPVKKVFGEFAWSRPEVSWSHKLGIEAFQFFDEDHVVTDFLNEAWLSPVSQTLINGHLLDGPSGLVKGKMSAKNESSCRANFEYRRGKSLHLYPNL